MKELSIEEEAKAYDEVRKKIAIRFGSNVADEIFYQFGMSEDEMIRKELLDFCKNRAEYYPNDPKYENISAWIAWLEKQGEQKPADRVKLMFKVGDWIIYDRHISKVKDMDSEGYLVEDTYGDEGILPKEFAEKHYHLWTIAEAKDGDVLADDRAILLFRNLGNKNWKDVISYYAVLETNLNNWFSISDDEEYWGKVEDCELNPATKKQRDTLMKAMAGAGYTFDFEKKELKNIGQKTADIERGAKGNEREIPNSAWNEEDECTLNGILADYKSMCKTYRDWLESLKNRVQTKQEWSEEDKERFESCIKVLQTSDGYDTINAKWFKSLKDRYTWKPSDEQMITLRHVISGCSYDIEPLVEIEEHLKKLRKEDV